MPNTTEPVSPAKKGIIFTRSIKHFRKKLQIPLLLGEATILVIHGAAGIGKTTAIDYHIGSLKPQAHSGFPSCLKVVVPSHPTPLKLMMAIMASLREKLKGEDDDYLQQIVDALTKKDIWLLIFDEGDRLDADTFETLRDIFDRSERSLVIVGLPRIVKVVERYPQLDSRTLYEAFEPIDLKELIHDFLPKLSISQWKFDPREPKDREMARYLWERAAPSLRKLVRWIRRANVEAVVTKKERITMAEIRAAMNSVGLKQKRKVRRIYQDKGEFEHNSEIRHEARQLNKDEP